MGARSRSSKSTLLLVLVASFVYKMVDFYIVPHWYVNDSNLLIYRNVNSK